MSFTPSVLLCELRLSRGSSLRMAEFGAKPCSNSGCLQHDFLPFICPACSRSFCLEHFAIGSHVCEEGQAFLASRRHEGGAPMAVASTPSSHPLSSSKPSDVMAAVTSRFDGREGELNAEVAHYNIKASTGGDAGVGAPDELLKKSQMAVDGAVTEKGKRVSEKVHRMLLKSKAVGDKNLRMEDRFFLEVHYWGNDDDVHHLFFSRLWTVGRTLDEIVNTRRRFLNFGPGEEGEPLDLARAGSPSRLPPAGVLHTLGQRLQSFDAVTVSPRTAVLAVVAEGSSAATATGSGANGEGVQLSEALTPDAGEEHGRQKESATREAGKNDRASSPEQVELEKPYAVLAGANAAPGMTITIGHGKKVYQLGGVLPGGSVLDLKRRLEPLTGVPFVRQKLVFKGILRDSDLVGATKITDGAKVMLLGAPRP